MVPVSYSEPIVQTYFVYSGVLALKVLVMAPLTGRIRLSKGIFANEEDKKLHPKGVVKFDDPEVERYRRAHLNDLENIPVFWILGGLYLTTGPDPEVATWLFRVYTAGRIIHSLVYAVNPMPQPTRGLAFTVSSLITWYMGWKVVSHYFNAL